MKDESGTGRSPEDAPETGAEIIARLEKEAEEKKSAQDRAALMAPINAFIKGLNSIIGQAFRAGRGRGVKFETTFKAIVGGLAASSAGVFPLIKSRLGSGMTSKEFEETFLGMYRAAVRSIGGEKGGSAHS